MSYYISCVIMNDDTKLLKKIFERDGIPEKSTLNKLIVEACTQQQSEIVKILVEYGADVNFIDEFGNTPLHESVMNCTEECIVALLDCGANINIISGSTNKATPLHYAVGNRNKELVELLLERGADKNIKDGKSRTPADLLKYDNEPRYKKLFEYINNFECMDIKEPYSEEN